MCLYVKRGCKPEIAQKDIVCYKVVVDRGRSWEPACGYSNNHFPYNKVTTALRHSLLHNCEVEIDHLTVRKGFYMSVVEEGFHASLRESMFPNICIIPAGTQICYGTEDEIVAVQMIVFRTKLNYYWYKLKKKLCATKEFVEWLKPIKEQMKGE